MSSGTPTTSKTSDKETDTVKRDSEDLDPLDDNCCSICIDEIKEMCYTDTCLHRFCYIWFDFKIFIKMIETI